MKKDYFAILGVKPSASQKEIKSAYKKLAKKCHPDLNPDNKRAEEKFKEISEAHDVLTDPEKRRRWEAGDIDPGSIFGRGRAGGHGGGTRGSAGVGDPFSVFEFSSTGALGGIFGDLFGAMGGARTADGARGAGARARSRSRGAGADLQYEATLTFEEAVRGTTVKIALDRSVTCEVCGGAGLIRKGGSRSRGEACGNCSGAGVLMREEKIQVRIPPGAEDGSRMRVPGKGEAGVRGGPPGDLYVVLRVAPHRYFRREGKDILLDLPLSIGEAALGTQITVPTIDGPVKLTVPASSSSGQRLRLKERGVQAPPGGKRGDQIVVLQIVTPRGIDAASRGMLEEFDRLNPTDPRSGVGW